jgi:hypothetical protein
MGGMKRRKCGDFFLQQRWPEAAMVAARGRPAAAVPALFRRGKEEGGPWGWVAQKAEWADWLLGRLGQMLKKSFQNKN